MNHLKISLIKSFCRLIGLVCIPLSLWFGLALLGLAELLGIIEELI